MLLIGRILTRNIVCSVKGRGIGYQHPQLRITGLGTIYQIFLPMAVIDKNALSVRVKNEVSKIHKEKNEWLPC